MKKEFVEGLREKYIQDVLLEEKLSTDPFEQFNLWFKQAVDSKCLEPNAMALATVTLDHKPTARIVLFKGWSERQGLTFYTNYNSHKGRHLNGNPFAAVLFSWLTLARQIRIAGRVKKLSTAESEAYFHSRPRGSQVGAWVSNQSETILDRSVLEQSLKMYQEKFRDNEAIPMPPNWGGYELIPESFEFWQGNENRLHDRIKYQLESNRWQMTRLAP